MLASGGRQDRRANQVIETGNVKTARLLGHPICEDDFDDLYALHQNPKVMATLGGTLRDREETASFLRLLTDCWLQDGLGPWHWHHAETGQFVGRGGLRHLEVDGEQVVEILYALMPDYWGQGYATEIAAFSATYAFDQAGLDNVVAFTMKSNIASQKVMEKIGMTYEKDIMRADLPHVFYRMNNKNALAAR